MLVSLNEARDVQYDWHFLGPSDVAVVVARLAINLDRLAVAQRLRFIQANIEVTIAAPATGLVAGAESNQRPRSGSGANGGDKRIAVVVVDLEIKRELHAADAAVVDDRGSIARVA